MASGGRSSFGENMTPHQDLYREPANLSNVRVFGCDLYRWNNFARSNEFDENANRGVYVGVSSNRKGWLSYDLLARKLYTSYHCTFIEDFNEKRLLEKRMGFDKLAVGRRLIDAREIFQPDENDVLRLDDGDVTDSSTGDPIPDVAAGDRHRRNPTRSRGSAGDDDHPEEQEREKESEVTKSDVLGQRRGESPSATGDDEETTERLDHSQQRGGNESRAHPPPDSWSSGNEPKKNGADQDNDQDGVEVEIPQRQTQRGRFEKLTDRHLLFLRTA